MSYFLINDKQFVRWKNDDEYLWIMIGLFAGTTSQPSLMYALIRQDLIDEYESDILAGKTNWINETTWINSYECEFLLPSPN